MSFQQLTFTQHSTSTIRFQSRKNNLKLFSYASPQHTHFCLPLRGNRLQLQSLQGNRCAHVKANFDVLVTVPRSLRSGSESGCGSRHLTTQGITWLIKDESSRQVYAGSVTKLHSCLLYSKEEELLINSSSYN